MSSHLDRVQNIYTNRIIDGVGCIYSDTLVVRAGGIYTAGLICRVVGIYTITFTLSVFIQQSFMLVGCVYLQSYRQCRRCL